MTTEQLGVTLLLGSVVLLAAVVAVRMSTGSGLPSLLLYLALGLLIGEGGLGLEFDDAELTALLGYVALILILAEGGLTTRWSTIRPVGGARRRAGDRRDGRSPSPSTGTAAHFLLGMEWTLALLLGAAISSTDAAAVFSVLRRVPLPSRLVGMLEAESGFNDAPVVIAVVALTEIASGHDSHPWWYLVGEAALRAGRRRRRRARRGLARARRRCARWRCRRPVSTRSPSWAWRSARTARPTSRTRPGSSRRTSPRWCSATSGCRTAPPSAGSPRASAGWRRSACSCCWACWPRPAGCPRSCGRRSSSASCCCSWHGRSRC